MEYGLDEKMLLENQMREYFMYSTNDNVVFNFNKMKDRFLLVYNNKLYNAVNIENKYRLIQNPNILENIS